MVDEQSIIDQIRREVDSIQQGLWPPDRFYVTRIMTNQREYGPMFFQKIARVIDSLTPFQPDNCNGQRSVKVSTHSSTGAIRTASILVSGNADKSFPVCRILVRRLSPSIRTRPSTASVSISPTEAFTNWRSSRRRDGASGSERYPMTYPWIAFRGSRYLLAETRRWKRHSSREVLIRTRRKKVRKKGQDTLLGDIGNWILVISLLFHRTTFPRSRSTCSSYLFSSLGHGLVLAFLVPRSRSRSS